MIVKKVKEKIIKSLNDGKFIFTKAGSRNGEFYTIGYDEENDCLFTRTWDGDDAIEDTEDIDFYIMNNEEILDG